MTLKNSKMIYHLGTDIDSCNEQTLDIEIFPDRPDLLSGETLAHSMLPFLYGQQPNPTIPSTEGNLKMVVNPELSQHTARNLCCRSQKRHLR